MDALGAHAPEPDDRKMFEAIVSELDGTAIEQAATAPSPSPATASASAPAAKQKATTTESSSPEGKQPPQRGLRDALVDWIDQRTQDRIERRVERAEAKVAKKAAAKPTADPMANHITLGAFITVSVITLAVSVLSFALSFDMMLEAAQLYGWGPELAKLFPIMIDVGAVGGTFMGSIASNATYRRVGFQIMIVTLASSVLFNLVGHEVKAERASKAATEAANNPATAGKHADALPESWGWTGPVAAVLIPVLLAYFVHAFSKALKTFTEQRREVKAKAKRERQEQERLAAEAAAEAQRENDERRKRDLLARAAEEAARERAAQKEKAAVEAAAKPPAKKIEKPSKPQLDAQAAREWVQTQPPGTGPSQVQQHFARLGYEVPTDRTIRRWLNETEPAD